MTGDNTMRGTDDLGKLVLRLTLGILLLFHGVKKITGGIGFVHTMVVAHGLPPQVAYLVYIGEVVAPVLLILGFYSRIGGLIVVINMLFALFLVHMHQLGSLAPTGGWALELQAFYLVSGLCVLLLGAGRFSISGGRGTWD